MADRRAADADLWRKLHLPHAAPNALFLQFGNQDTRPSAAKAEEVAAAASSLKKVESYDGGHESNDLAKADRETGSRSAGS